MDTKLAKKLLKVGSSVIVTVLDSCRGVDGTPARHDCRLLHNETHGRVTFLGSDPELCVRHCGKRCIQKCWYLELAMDSACAEDERSSLAALWVPCIVEVKVFRA